MHPGCHLHDFVNKSRARLNLFPDKVKFPQVSKIRSIVITVCYASWLSKEYFAERLAIFFSIPYNINKNCSLEKNKEYILLTKQCLHIMNFLGTKMIKKLRLK